MRFSRVFKVKSIKYAFNCASYVRLMREVEVEGIIYVFL